MSHGPDTGAKFHESLDRYPGRTEDGKRVPMEVKAGDKVLYGKYSGTEVTIDGEQLLILRESDILAIVK